MKSRKPSVLVSRRFTSDALNLGNPNSDSSKREKQEPPRLIENGKDVTPKPLFSRNHLPSIEDIDFDNDDDSDYDSESSDVENVSTMPWIPKLVSSMMDRAILSSKTSSSLRRTRDSIPLYEAPCDSCQGTAKAKCNGDCSLSHTHIASETGSRDALSPSRTFLVKQTQDSSGLSSQPVHIDEQCVETDAIFTASIGTSTVTPELKDSSCNHGNAGEENEVENDEQERIENIVEAIMAANEHLLDTSEGRIQSSPIPPHQDSLKDGKGEIYFESIGIAKMRHKALHSDNVRDRLRLLERAVQQNNFRWQQQLKYRGGIQVNGKLQNEGNQPKIQLLFNFQCTITLNRIVTCMSLHHASRDVIAVGYSEVHHTFGHSEDHWAHASKHESGQGRRRDGLVLLWSPRNPSFPDKVIRSKSPVTTIAFSSETPTVLAVGMEDGNISLFDTSQSQLDSMVNSASIPGRHMSTVTEIIWIVDQQSHTEKLVSTSIDGRVVQWSIKKGMTLHPLMTLNLLSINHTTKLSRTAMALCIDFPKGGDSSHYVTGCEDGSLFLCSRSYTEKQLCLVKGHTGPVTSVKFSPINNDTFLSCSGDSSIKMWTYSNRLHQLEFQLEISPVNLWAPVNDVAWSPTNATMFSMVSADGRLQVWDITKSQLDPVLNISPRNIEYTNILFTDSHNIVVGSEDGKVEIYSTALV